MATVPKRVAPRRKPVPDLAKVHTLAEEVEALKRQIDALQKEREGKRRELFTLVESIPGEETVFQTADGMVLTAQIVRPEPLVLDEAKLKTRVGAKVWKKITVAVLDKGLLGAAIKTGLVSSSMVAEVTEVVPGTPYVKVSVK